MPPAYALASQALGRKDQAKRQPLADRAIGLLKAAIAGGYSDYKHMQEDTDLDAIRDLPAFGEIMKGGHLDRSYAAVWTGDAGFEAIPVFGLNPGDHLKSPPRAGSQRAIAWSRCRSPGLLAGVAARRPPSVWHRAGAVSEEARGSTGRAARLGPPWRWSGSGERARSGRLLRHSAGPPAAELHRSTG